MTSFEMVSLENAAQLPEVTNSYILRSQHTTRDCLNTPDVTTLPELFRWQAQRRRDATLFSFRIQPGASLITVSYAEAYRTSSQLAHSLHKLHQNSTSIESTEIPVVGVWLERSIELHLAILATTISGATWLPFDADAPAARVTACLKDSKACILLCDAAHYAPAIKATENILGCRVVTFEELNREKKGPRGTAKKFPGPRAHHTAYMIYTSGSTGSPKGKLRSC
jgi:non-ribosomal peptide synthetase component F